MDYSKMQHHARKPFKMNEKNKQTNPRRDCDTCVIVCEAREKGRRIERDTATLNQLIALRTPCSRTCHAHNHCVDELERLRPSAIAFRTTLQLSSIHLKTAK